MNDQRHTPSPAPQTAAAEPATSEQPASPISGGILHRKIARRRLARQADGGNGVQSHAAAAVEQAASSSGSPLPDNLKQKFEASLSADLSAVRVHTGAASATAADAVSARAYTVGNDIHFNGGQYNPSSRDGESLLAHEVAHTQQQGGQASAVSPQFKLEVSAPEDSHEQEADRAAAAMVEGHPATTSSSVHSGVNRSKTDGKNTDGEKDKSNPLVLPAFAQNRLRSVEALPMDEMSQLIVGAKQEGPQGVIVRDGSGQSRCYFVVVEKGSVKGWMPAAELEEGAYRLDIYWVSVRHGMVEIGRRYPEDASSNQEHLSSTSKILGIQPDPAVAEKRASAAQTLNHDIEAYLAKGRSLTDARAETLKTANDVLRLMIVASVIIIASFPFAAGPEIAGIKRPPRSNLGRIGGGSGGGAKLTVHGNRVLSASEQAAADYWTGQGHNVEAPLTASEEGVSGVRTADFQVEGVGSVDVYGPEPTTSANNLVRAILKKSGQTSTVHVELPSGSQVSPEQVSRLPSRVFGHPEAGKGIQRILVRQNGSVILDGARRGE